LAFDDRCCWPGDIACACSDYFLQSELMLTLTWMLDHSSRKIQVEARRLLDSLRVGTLALLPASHPSLRLPPSRSVALSGGDGPASDSVSEEAAAAVNDRAFATPGTDAFLMAMVDRGCVPVLQVHDCHTVRRVAGPSGDG
jgi:hypothetical protein